MNKFVIISDSSLDLPKQTRLDFELEYPIPGKVIFSDGRVEDADSEWEKSNPEKYFNDELKKGIKTSLPNGFEICERLEPYFKDGKDILAIVLSTGISGTYSAFVKAGEELMAKYPERKIIVIDSLRYSSGVGLLNIYASVLRKEGKTIEETAEWIEAHKRNMHQIGTLDDLHFLARNGKITGFKAFMGTMVGVKPMADFSNTTGQPFPLGNVRGYKKVYKMAKEYMLRTIGNPDGKIFVVEHSMRPDQAEELRKVVEETFHPQTLIMSRCGQTNGSAIGPGLATIFYLADEPVSENCEKEVALFKEISANL